MQPEARDALPPLVGVLFDRMEHRLLVTAPIFALAFAGSMMLGRPLSGAPQNPSQTGQRTAQPGNQSAPQPAQGQGRAGQDGRSGQGGGDGAGQNAGAGVGGVGAPRGRGPAGPPPRNAEGRALLTSVSAADKGVWL